MDRFISLFSKREKNTSLTIWYLNEPFVIYLYTYLFFFFFFVFAISHVSRENCATWCTLAQVPIKFHSRFRATGSKQRGAMKNQVRWILPPISEFSCARCPQSRTHEWKTPCVLVTAVTKSRSSRITATCATELQQRSRAVPVNKFHTHALVTWLSPTRRTYLRCAHSSFLPTRLPGTAKTRAVLASCTVINKRKSRRRGTMVPRNLAKRDAWYTWGVFPIVREK